MKHDFLIPKGKMAMLMSHDGQIGYGTSEEEQGTRREELKRALLNGGKIKLTYPFYEDLLDRLEKLVENKDEVPKVSDEDLILREAELLFVEKMINKFEEVHNELKEYLETIRVLSNNRKKWLQKEQIKADMKTEETQNRDN